MQAIKRIIKRVDFKDFNIPDSFGEQAQMIILPFSDLNSENEAFTFDLLKLQEKSGMINMLNEPEEDIWNEL